MFRRLRPQNISIQDLIDLIFGSVSPEQNHQLHHIAQTAVTRGHDPLRALILQVDQQISPTRLTSRFGPSDIEWITIDGLTFATDSSEGSVSPQVANGYEPHVSAAIERILEPGSIFIDIGANIGLHTARAARQVGPSGRVIAVEPNSENCRLLLLTAAKNKLDNVSLIPVALAETGEWTSFSTHIGSNGGFIASNESTIESGYGSIVPLRRLDDIAPPRTRLIKIDVEGAELSVLKSGQHMLARDRPQIIMEFSCEMVQRVSHLPADQALAWLEGLGYDLAIIDHASHRPLPRSAKELLDSWGDPSGIEDLLLTPR